MQFLSDNTSGASEKVLCAILAAGRCGNAAPYGRDAITVRVGRAFDRFFERPVESFLVTTGTAANALASAALCPPWGSLLTHAESHVMEDECGAPEFFMHGAKLTGIAGIGGKITPAALEETLALFADSPNRPPPRALSISNATEFGLVYTPDEIAALARVAKGAGLGLHMDGARFSNALAALRCSPADLTWRAGIDALSFGATKNGCFMAEAVIFFDPRLAADFVVKRKRAGQTLSKSHLIAAQFEAYLDQDHWLDLARHACARARELADGLAALPGIRLGFPCEINEVFPILSEALAADLRGSGLEAYTWSAGALAPRNRLREGETLLRLVTSFATEKSDVEAFLACARDLADRYARR